MGEVVAAESTVSVSLKPDGTSLEVGKTHTVTAQVSTSRQGTMTIQVVGGVNDGRALKVTQTGDVSWTGSYTSDAAGTDSIKATFTVAPSYGEGAASYESDTVSHEWTSPVKPGSTIELALAPNGSTAQVGQEHTVTVTVTGNASQLAVMVVDGKNKGRKLAVVGSASPFTASYTSRVDGGDSIRATVYDSQAEEYRSSNTVTHTWTPAPVVKVKLEPDKTSSVIETRHSLTGLVAGDASGT